MTLPPAPLAERVSPSRPPLRGAALHIARAVWVALAVLTLGFFVASIPAHIARLSGLPLPMHTNLMQMGLSIEFYTLYILIIEGGAVLAYAITAVVVFAYKSDDRMTLFVSLALLMFGATIFNTLDSLALVHPELGMPVFMLRVSGLSAMLLVLYLFPDGRFTPRWTRTLTYIWPIWLLIWALSPAALPAVAQLSRLEQAILYVFFRDSSRIVEIYTTLRVFSLYLVMFGWFITGAVAQVYRYLRASTPDQRQQTKWVVFGFVGGVFLYFGSSLPALFVPAFQTFTPPALIYMLVREPLSAFGLLLVPFTLSISIMRYRLWDVDLLIHRTLVYGAVTAVLGLLYFGSVVLFQQLFSFVAGYQSTFAIAVTTLLIASLIRPLRRRLQNWVDRSFYREKVDFRKAFTDFSRQVRTLIDLPELLHFLAERTISLLHSEYGSIYLYRPDEYLFRLVESCNSESCPEPDIGGHLSLSELALEDAQLNGLRKGSAIMRAKHPTYPILVPLLAPQSESTTQGERTPLPLLGVLALGPRLSGLSYSREDQSLLMGLADQAGTAIYVAQLIQDKQSEVRRRAEAEQQLEEHRNSPLGRAEDLAQLLLAQPEWAIPQLHQLAQNAGRDPGAANVLGHLSGVLSSHTAGPLTALAEGFNYIFASQFTAELLPAGLRALIVGLNAAAQPPETQLPEGQAPFELAWKDDALAVYRLCQIALDANSIAQIVQIQGVEERGGADKELAPFPYPLTDLERALGELQPVMHALHAYERVDTSQDKLAYLASAVDRLRHADHFAGAELGSADRPLVEQLIKDWLAIVASAMTELQTRARLVCQLLTRHTWQDDVISIALSLHNAGRGAALNLRVSLLPDAAYTLIDDTARLERLSPGEEAQVLLRVRPRLGSGVDSFRARFAILYTDPRGSDQIENFADIIHLMTTGGEFQFIPNPYVVGTPLQAGSPLFFGREDIITFVHENMAASHHNNLVLIGQRRTGKTSLLKQLPVRLGDEIMTIYLDGQALGLDPGMPNFFLNLATEIAFALEDRGFEIETPEAKGFAESPAAVFERDFLARVREAIGSRHLLIMLDEFEELEAAVRRGALDSSIFAFLRHLIQHYPKGDSSGGLSVIFCGTHRLEELVADYWNVLFNISLYHHIGFLEKSEAMRLIREPVEAFGMRYDDLALDKIWRVTAGHPYFLQLLCHSLVNRHNRTRRNYITIADVNAALDEILASGEAHFVYLWTESTPAERLTLTALSRMIPLTGQATPVQVIEYLLERGISLERQEISQAMHYLALRSVLNASNLDQDSFSETYQWNLGLLGMWVEKYKSLSRVVDE